MLNLAYKILLRIRQLYWWLFRPTTIGVKAFILCGEKILLIKNRYDIFWYLPGGGVKKNECITDTVTREIKEECGLIVNDWQIWGIYSNFSEYKNDHIVLFVTHVGNLFSTQGSEIEKIEFFDLKNLPENVSSATKKRVKEYLATEIHSGIW